MDSRFMKMYNNYIDKCVHKGYTEAEYCAEEMMCGASFKWYEKLSEIAAKNNVKRIIDIGANTGLQRFFFEEKGIKYVPVDCRPLPNINGSLNGLIKKKYPCKLEYQDGDMLVSKLCLGYLVGVSGCKKEMSKYNMIALDFPSDYLAEEYKQHTNIYTNEYGGMVIYEKKND